MGDRYLQASKTIPGASPQINLPCGLRVQCLGAVVEGLLNFEPEALNPKLDSWPRKSGLSRFRVWVKDVRNWVLETTNNNFHLSFRYPYTTPRYYSSFILFSIII